MKSDNTILRTIRPDELPDARYNPVDEATLEVSAMILKDVRTGGFGKVREYAEQFGDCSSGDTLIIEQSQLQAVLQQLSTEEQDLLKRTAARIGRFAEAQRNSVSTLTTPIAGGRAGHRVMPVEVAGCYAPGGRFPLPSTVLMTAVTARVAGVSTVWVASPKPSPATLAAAAVAGVDAVLAAGGVQAIGAMAYGLGDVPRCDVIVGPGNRWVSAAKQLVSGPVAIDMIAGPSELVVLADDRADPMLVALDLLAQAEHDTDALPVLVTPSERLIEGVQSQLKRLLEETPDDTATTALSNGFAVLVPDLATGADVCNRIAPEHLQLSLQQPSEVITRLTDYGGLFIGEHSAEVLGDYGAGPNHVLPTSGVARHTAGLSVLNFLRFPTWLEMTESSEARQVASDAAALAELEGLRWHARAARARSGQ